MINDFIKRTFKPTEKKAKISKNENGIFDVENFNMDEIWENAEDEIDDTSDCFPGH